MKSTFETEIDGPHAKVAELYSNPDNIVKWMDDVRKCEHISGPAAKTGSKYRFVPKKGDMEFVATILEKSATQCKMKMEGANVDIMVTGTFVEVAPGKTKFTSEEVFTFKGFLNKLVGLASGAAVKTAHAKHMKAFKKFANAAVKTPAAVPSHKSKVRTTQKSSAKSVSSGTKSGESRKADKAKTQRH